jgi:hypothetical protein
MSIASDPNKFHKPETFICMNSSGLISGSFFCDIFCLQLRICDSLVDFAYWAYRLKTENLYDLSNVLM